MICTNGKRYIGHWKKGKKDGKGTIVYIYYYLVYKMDNKKMVIGKKTILLNGKVDYYFYCLIQILFIFIISIK